MLISKSNTSIREFPKIGGPFRGPYIGRTTVYWGPPIEGNYHVEGLDFKDIAAP